MEAINQNTEELTSEQSWGSEFSGKYLTFNLASEDYGIAILKIREIIGMIPVTKVPRMPDYIKGVINLRGRVIPVIDLRLRFGIEQKEYTRRTCIIVVDVMASKGSMLVGVIVDSVDEVVNFGCPQIEPAPAYGNGLKTDFILCMGKVESDVKILLDIDRILNQTELFKLQESS